MTKATKTTDTIEATEAAEPTPDTTADTSPAPAAPVDTDTTAETEQPADEQPAPEEPDADSVKAIWSVLEDGKPHFLRELVAAAPALTADVIKRLMSTYREERRVQFVYDERAARRNRGRGETKYRATRW